jgi:beta-lactamase class A
MGDTTTRLDRNEPTLNSAEAGDERDTTTPAAMVNTLRTLLLGDALSPASRQQWVQWLIDCETGDDRLRAGLPEKWQVGDKTGTGDHGTANDIAIAWPPGRKPILIASYLTQSTLDKDGQNAVHAGVAKLLAHTFHG